jgi:hypothetical protein
MTRSNSPMPVGRLAACAAETVLMRMAGLAGRRALGTDDEPVPTLCRGGAAVSSIEPHSPQSGHWPTHLGTRTPHAPQA